MLVIMFIYLIIVPWVMFHGYVISFKNFRIILHENGVLDIISNNVKASGFGLACWSKNWSGFTHQLTWPRGSLVKIENKSIVKGNVTCYGGVLSYIIRVSSCSSNVVLLEVKVFTLSKIFIQGLVWGSWNLLVKDFANRVVIIYKNVVSEETRFPLKKLKSRIIYSYHAHDKGLMIAVAIPSMKLLFVPINVSGFSIEDERFWGSNSYSIRFWMETSIQDPFISSFKLLIISYDKNLDLIIRALRFLFFSNYNETLFKLISKGKFEEVVRMGEVMWRVRVNRTFPWLRVKDFYIIDDEGYYVLLRGANYMGMEFGWFGHSEEDFKKMASWGFNVVRIPIGWAYIEPVPGVINEDYLKLIDRVISWAKKYGLYAVLDMHQWRWSKKYKGCGMPDWIVPDASDYLEASVKFFTNKTLWEKFARVWKILAERYKNESAIAAYDIFNEPMPKYDIMSKSDFLRYVEEFYKYIISEIRKVDKKHIVMYMPIWGGDLEGTPFIRDYNVVLTVHYYVGGTWDGKTGYEKVTFEELRSAVKVAVNLAKERGVPLWIGEFGVGSSAYKAHEWARDVVKCFDEYCIGYAWWTFWRNKDRFGLLYPDGREKEHILIVLDRPYIRRTTVPLISMMFNLETKEFEAILNTKDVSNFKAEIYIPSRHYQNFTVTCKANGLVIEVKSRFDRKTRLLYIEAENMKANKVTIKISPTKPIKIKKEAFPRKYIKSLIILLSILAPVIMLIIISYILKRVYAKS
ncbi:MAG: hypothetical protein DRN53_01230 [Thermoprotei archaeon]|nr:MAG: hypothetical protein DRN53_01230 [Thermoprotei archaeon]